MTQSYTGFFDPHYKTPNWFRKKYHRRQFLKTTAIGSALSLTPSFSMASSSSTSSVPNDEPWLTLDAVQQHLLPDSDSGPGAKALNALTYLYNVTEVHGLSEEEVNFIFKGVGWLNGFTQQSYQKQFIDLTTSEKETALRKISQSRAGENWLSTMINYLLEAMLTPPSYGGNPNGIGWQWLGHQPGFPLPSEGQRFYELPGQSTNKTGQTTNAQAQPIQEKNQTLGDIKVTFLPKASASGKSV